MGRPCETVPAVRTGPDPGGSQTGALCRGSAGLQGTWGHGLGVH